MMHKYSNIQFVANNTFDWGKWFVCICISMSNGNTQTKCCYMIENLLIGNDFTHKTSFTELVTNNGRRSPINRKHFICMCLQVIRHLK